MVCRIEALVQVHQLCAQVLDVPVKILEGFVSEVEERRSGGLTSSEKPGISYGAGVGQRKKFTKLGNVRDSRPFGIVPKLQVQDAIFRSLGPLYRGTVLKLLALFEGYRMRSPRD